MAEESRDGRPNRPDGLRGARTGVVALLALSAGAGCGQAMLRPATGPGLAAQALGQVNEDVPGRQLGWDQPGQASAREALVAKGGGSAKTGLPPAGPISLDGVTAGPPPSPMIATFDGSTFARTTWNGWKLPGPRPFGAVGGPVVASAAGRDPLEVASRLAKIELPRPRANAPGIRLVDESLLAACRESKIAPPVRRGTPGRAPAPVAAVDGLAAACRESKIAPPRPKAKTVAAPPQDRPEPPTHALAQVTPAPAPAPVVTEAPARDVVKEPKASPALEVKVAEVSAPATEPKENQVKPSSPTPAEAQPMPLLSATPSAAPATTEIASAAPEPAQVQVQVPEPAQAPEPAGAPTPAPTEPLESQAALPDRRPVRLPRRSQPSGTVEATVAMPIHSAETGTVAVSAGQGAPPPPLDDAFRVTRIDPPRRPEPDSPGEASLMSSIELPHHTESTPSEPDQAPPTLEEASRVTSIELPHRTEPTPSEPDQAPPTPEEASRVTSIELPHRTEPTPSEPDQASPTPEEASRMSSIELPHRPDSPEADAEAAEARTIRIDGAAETRAVAAAEEMIAETAAPPAEVATPRVDPLQEACEAAQIPPPIPGRFPN